MGLMDRCRAARLSHGLLAGMHRRCLDPWLHPPLPPHLRSQCLPPALGQAFQMIRARSRCSRLSGARPLRLPAASAPSMPLGGAVPIVRKRLSPTPTDCPCRRSRSAAWCHRARSALESEAGNSRRAAPPGKLCPSQCSSSVGRRSGKKIRKEAGKLPLLLSSWAAPAPAAGSGSMSSGQLAGSKLTSFCSSTSRTYAGTEQEAG